MGLRRAVDVRGRQFSDVRYTHTARRSAAAHRRHARASSTRSLAGPPTAAAKRPELRIEWGLVRVAIDVGRHITDGEAKRFKTTMLQKAQRLSTEPVPSM